MDSILDTPIAVNYLTEDYNSLRKIIHSWAWEFCLDPDTTITHIEKDLLPLCEAKMNEFTFWEKSREQALIHADHLVKDRNDPDWELAFKRAHYRITADSFTPPTPRRCTCTCPKCGGSL